MAVTYSLRAAYIGNYAGGVIGVGSAGSAFDVGAALTSGGGEIIANTTELVNELDRYPPLYRIADDGEPLVHGIDVRMRALSVGAGASGTETTFEVHLDNETYPRFMVDAEGEVWQGDGDNPPDAFEGGGPGPGTGTVDNNIFTGTWAARSDAEVVLWIGGGSADNPEDDMEDGDIWFPSEA